MIRNGSSVTINFTLRVEGQIVDSSEGAAPLTYTHGAGQIVRGLEEALATLQAGDKVTVVVPPEKGYGLRNLQAVQVLPKEVLQDIRDVHLGDRVQGLVADQEFEARVVAIGAEDITLDLNHPLAGKTLYFEVEILKVK